LAIYRREKHDQLKAFQFLTWTYPLNQRMDFRFLISARTCVGDVLSLIMVYSLNQV
jgi:hypothetical protein